MTCTQDKLALAERCEQAAGPSKHLDAQIWILLDPNAQHIVGNEPGRFPRKAIYGPRSTFWDWALDETVEPPVFDYPAYTASLDAAMTLVPEGWAKYLSDDEHGCHACVWDRTSPSRSGGCKDAPNITLALCAAALRARVQS